MDISQSFGSSSSYARKYALNGLFLIDDTKDADTDEQAKQINAPKPSVKQNGQPILQFQKDSKQWQGMLKAMEKGETFTLEGIQKKYKVSKETAKQLAELGIK